MALEMGTTLIQLKDRKEMGPQCYNCKELSSTSCQNVDRNWFSLVRKDHVLPTAWFQPNQMGVRLLIDRNVNS